MNPSKQVHELIQAIFSGEATPQQVRALEDWLLEDSSHVQLLVDLALLDGMILDKQKNEDAAAVLNLLSELEEQAEPDFTLLQVPVTETPSADPGEESVTFQDLWSAASYLTAKGLHSRAGMIGSIAAVLVIAVVLFFVFSGAPTQTLQPNSIVDDGSATPRVVAALTAERDAEWERRPGQDLYAGQRLTLTAGLAEITTANGAIAILEAPATIELIHQNALRLDAGKLLGICETDASKGFRVRTPHMDITDLGTRFGVDASKLGATQVHVIEGMVEVASPVIDTSGPVRLSARQALRVDSVKSQQVVYMSSPFDNALAIAQPRPRFEGLATQWLGRPPADLTLGQQTSLALQVFIEQRGLVLDRDTAVDFNAEHAWPASGIGQHTVAVGTRVDVYLLHLDTPGESGDSFIRDGQYTVHFDRPILGVIGAASSLRATDAVLGTKGVSYPVIDPNAEDPKQETASGIDYPGGWSFVDSAEVVNNGTSLHLSLTTGAMMDQVRVLVAADPAGEHP